MFGNLCVPIVPIILAIFVNAGSTGSTPKKAPTATPKKEEKITTPKMTPEKRLSASTPSSSSSKSFVFGPPTHKDNMFKEFRRICAAVAITPSYLVSTL